MDESERHLELIEGLNLKNERNRRIATTHRSSSRTAG